MLAPRSRPTELSHILLERSELADELFAADRAFFYSRFVVEEVLP
jgi:S-adenosylmethionine-diacylglycerol 3-amino-3-carboxypropyl transferase